MFLRDLHLAHLILFILFTNDLSNVVNNCGINLYADDTTYTCSKDPNLVSMHLQKDLKSIMDWVTRNGLEVNIAKTQLHDDTEYSGKAM